MKDPRREPETITDPRREDDEEVVRVQQAAKRMSSQIPPALEKLVETSRNQVEAAEKLARTVRQSRPKIAAVRPSGTATGDLTAKFAALKP